MKKVLLWGLALSLILAMISFVASSWPDGLEKVAEDKGFIDKGEVVLFNAPIPDYLFPNLSDERVATVLAGVMGVFITLTAAYLLARVLVK